MGRKSKNIKIELNRRIDELLRIGEKKVKDDKDNPNRAEGIHSIRTADTYRSIANSFADFLKGQGVRSMAEIERQHIEDYMLSRSDLSAYTHNRDLSAINKLLDTRYIPRDFGFQDRKYSHITNNRGTALYDTSEAKRNREQLDFVRATGIRRQSIATITPEQAIRNASGQVIGFNVIEKGGRERNCVVLEQERQRITELVNQKSTEQGANAPMFRAVDSNANPHYARREYAQALYTDLKLAHEQGYDYYDGLRSRFINEQALDKAVSRYNNEIVRGYDRDVMGEVSQNMGHNRIDVILYHYLK